jgi:hypothetical protein
MNPRRVPQPVGDGIHGLIHIQQDLGHDADIDNRLEEPKNCGEGAPALDYRDHPERAQGNICDSRKDDEKGRYEYGGVHSAIAPGKSLTGVWSAFSLRPPRVCRRRAPTFLQRGLQDLTRAIPPRDEHREYWFARLQDFRREISLVDESDPCFVLAHAHASTAVHFRKHGHAMAMPKIDEICQ